MIHASTSHAQRLRTLDALLDGTPRTESTWTRLCEELELWDDTDALEEHALPHIEERLQEWDDFARVAPPSWIEMLLEGEELPQMAIIRTLDLRRMNLSHEDAEILADAAEIRWVRHLNFAYNGLQNDGVIALTSSQALTNVTWLDLSGNSVEIDGISALANCPDLSRLRHLDLTGNWVTDEAALKLANSENLRHLETLILRGNPIREEGAKALANSPHLHAHIRDKWVDS